MTDRFLFLSIFAFASGIALYFALPFGPSLGFPVLICVLSAAVFVRYKNVSIPPAIAACFIFGFFYASIRTDLTSTKLLARSRRNADVTGVVERVEYGGEKDRVFVRAPDDFLFRISIPKTDRNIKGAEISLRANLYAPNSPDAFNRFDYARWSFFNGLSGTGSALEIKDLSEAVGGSFRSFIHFKAGNKLVDSLVLGYKSAIPKEEYDRIKSAGIAHVISISGFHLALVGGWLFFIFLFLAKLFPIWTRRFPARNLALPLTAAGLVFYLSLSGAEVATVRSFIMCAAGFAALLFNRRVLTIRNAALVFGAMLAMNPFWLVSAGFQLSFAAIFGLLCFFDGHRPAGGRIYNFLYLLIASSVVATVWTFPFVAYHFNSFPVYGLAGNLVLLPFFSVGIMPAVMIGAITAPLGWRFPLDAADWMYGMAIDIAEWIGRLPFAEADFRDIPPIALFMVFAGMFCRLVSEKRRAAILFVGAAVLTAAQPTPILRATGDGEIVGFRRDGATYFNANYSENHPFVVPRGNKKRANCRKGVCEYNTKNWSAVSVQRFMPLYNNLEKLCGYDFIISYLPLDLPECRNKVIKGGVKIYADGTVQKVEARKWGADFPEQKR